MYQNRFQIGKLPNFKCKIIKITEGQNISKYYSSFSKHNSKSKWHEDKLYINKNIFLPEKW